MELAPPPDEPPLGSRQHPRPRPTQLTPGNERTRHTEEDMRMAADSPRGWVHPDAAGEPAVEIFRPWPEQPKDPATADMPSRWEVLTQASRYLLDLHACTVTRHNLDVRDLAPGAVHAQLRR